MSYIIYTLLMDRILVLREKSDNDTYLARTNQWPCKNPEDSAGMIIK